MCVHPARWQGEATVCTRKRSGSPCMGREPKGKGKTLSDDVPPDTDWWKSRLIVQPLCTCPSLNFFPRALIQGSKGLPTNTGWKKSKGRGPGSSGRWTEARAPHLGCCFPVPGCFQKMNREKREPFPLQRDRPLEITSLVVGWWLPFPEYLLQHRGR